MKTKTDSLLALHMIAQQLESEQESALWEECSKLLSVLSQTQQDEQQYNTINHNASQFAKDQLKSHWDHLTVQVSETEHKLVQLIDSKDDKILEYLHQ